MENNKKMSTAEVVENNSENVKSVAEKQEAQACKNCEVKDKTIMRMENEKLDTYTTHKLITDEHKNQIENLERIKRNLTENEKINSEKLLTFETEKKDLLFADKYKKAGGIPERKDYFKKIVGDEHTPEEWLKATSTFPEFFKNEPKPETSISSNEFNNPNRKQTEDNDDGEDWSGDLSGVNFIT